MGDLIKDLDHLTVHKEGVGYQDVVLPNPAKTLADGSLAISGGSMEEKGLAAYRRHPQLLRDFAGQHQTLQNPLNAVGADANLSDTLPGHLAPVIFQHHGRRSRI